MKTSEQHFSVVAGHLIIGYIGLWAVGVLTAGMNRFMIPYGYLIRFIIYAGLIHAFIRWLCGINGLTLSDCRIPRFHLSLRGILVAALLPAVFLFIRISMQPGHWISNQMPYEEIIQRSFFLLFNTGFCSGIVEEMMFRGYLTKISEQHWGKIQGMIIPTVLFVLSHARTGLEPFSFLNQAMLIISISILLTIVTYQSGHIWDGAFIHAFWDIFVARNDVFSVDFVADSNAFFTYVLDHPFGHPLEKFNERQLLLLASAVLWGVIGLLLLFAKLRKRPLLGA